MKLLTLPFCDAVFVILEINCEGMFFNMSAVDGKGYIMANGVLLIKIKYELVVSQRFIVNENLLNVLPATKCF